MNNKLIIIIGLPSSGKTILSKSINKKSNNKYKIYDDFIPYFYDGRIINDLRNKKNIILNDPRLCNFKIFSLYMDIFKTYISKKDILLILFKNEKNKCIHNITSKNVKQNIIHYSKIYDITKYNTYNNYIISVYNNK